MLFGLLFLMLIGTAYLFGDRIERHTSKHLVTLVACLAFFGVLLDTIHVVIPWSKLMHGLVEDGGEMVIMSIITWYIFKLKPCAASNSVLRKQP